MKRHLVTGEGSARCLYCRGRGYYGDELSGGEAYCTCIDGKVLRDKGIEKEEEDEIESRGTVKDEEKREALVKWIAAETWRESVFLTPDPRWLLDTWEVLDEISEIAEIPKETLSEWVERGGKT